jgi:hypothetical protein
MSKVSHNGPRKVVLAATRLQEILETTNIHYSSPTKVKHHLTCFNNIFSNNELISNRFAVFVSCTHILNCETGY